MKKTKFNLGDVVIVDYRNRVETIYEEYKRVLYKPASEVSKFEEVDERKGMIVGARYIQEGYWHRGRYDEEGGWSDPPHLTNIKTKLVYLIRFGLTNKEVMFLEEDIIEEPFTVNWTAFPTRFVKITKEERESMSKASKSYPRDEKGRWTK